MYSPALHSHLIDANVAEARRRADQAARSDQGERSDQAARAARPRRYFVLTKARRGHLIVGPVNELARP